MEDRVGSIEVGKCADIVVVDGDLFSARVEELSSLDIWLTIVDGRLVHAMDPSLAT